MHAEREDKNVTENRAKIKEMVVSFYRNLLIKLVEEDQNASREFLENIPPLITKEDNLKLLATLFEEEITSMIFMMDKDKAPRTNGFPATFFHHLWDIVGDNVVKVVQEFQRHNSILKS